MRTPARLVGVVLVLLGCLAAPAGADVPDGPDVAASMWARPVRGAVARPFVAPLHPYGPGHRGADLAVGPGEPVRAAGPGTVTFAGVVAETLHVVVAHRDGLRTGYSFLASIAVAPGAVVNAGMILGTAGGPGAPDDSGHDGSVLHFSLRRGDVYLDPMALFAPVDLGAVVHLAPPDGP